MQIGKRTGEESGTTTEKETRPSVLEPVYAALGAADALVAKLRDLGADEASAGGQRDGRRGVGQVLAGARAVPGLAAGQVRGAATQTRARYAELAGRGRGLLRRGDGAGRPGLRPHLRQTVSRLRAVTATSGRGEESPVAAEPARRGVTRTAAARTAAPSPGPTRQVVRDVDAVRPAPPTPARGSGVEAASTATRAARRAAGRAATIRANASAAQRTAAPGSSPAS